MKKFIVFALLLLPVLRLSAQNDANRNAETDVIITSLGHYTTNLQKDIYYNGKIQHPEVGIICLLDTQEVCLYVIGCHPIVYYTGFLVKGLDNIKKFQESIYALYHKWNQWTKVAYDNNVTEIEKEFDIPFYCAIADIGEIVASKAERSQPLEQKETYASWIYDKNKGVNRVLFNSVYMGFSNEQELYSLAKLIDYDKVVLAKAQMEQELQKRENDKKLKAQQETLFR